MFIDESGQDQRQSPYEVLAGVTIEDKQIWRLIRKLSDAQDLGMFVRAYGSEAKAQKLLKKKVFKTIPRRWGLSILKDVRCLRGKSLKMGRR